MYGSQIFILVVTISTTSKCKLEVFFMFTMFYALKSTDYEVTEFVISENKTTFNVCMLRYSGKL